jgi:NAD(P)H-hydrate epimerase
VERLSAAIPEITWIALDEEAPGLISPGGWRRLTTEAPRFDAVVIGPGLGAQPATQRRARQLVAALEGSAVVDADGLNALAVGDRWWQGIRGRHVLTPHPGEFARLSGQAEAAAELSEDDDARATAAAEAAMRWGQTVVLKGAVSLVATPQGEILRSEVATPALATAGSGDVLAGCIGAFLAAGCDATTAAGCGVAVHGAAGMLAEQRIGRAGVMARDVAALLPEAMEGLRGDRP